MKEIEIGGHVILEGVVREVFSEELISEQRYQEVEEQAMQFSERVTFWAKEPGVQMPCGQVRLEPSSYYKKWRGWDPVRQQEKRMQPERNPGTRSQGALSA